jgi:uncharacterized protein
MQTHGVHVEVICGDLNDAGALGRVEAMLANNEAISLLINNAGFAGYYPFSSVEPKVIDDLIGVHIHAVVRI